MAHILVSPLPGLECFISCVPSAARWAKLSRACGADSPAGLLRPQRPLPNDLRVYYRAPFGYTNILLASPVFSSSMPEAKSFIAMRFVITGCRSSLPALSSAVI